MDTRTQATPAAATQATNPAPADQRAAAEAQALANTAIYLRICANTILDLQDRMMQLQDRFDDYTNESSLRQNVKKVIIGLGAAAALAYIVTSGFYHFSSTCSTQLGALDSMWYESLGLTGLGTALYYANYKPEDRPFKWNDKLAKFVSGDHVKIMSEYDKFLGDLRLLYTHLNSTYGADNPGLQLIYSDLEAEIEILRQKDDMTITKVREEMTKVTKIVDYTKNVMESTKPHIMGLFSRNGRPPVRENRALDMRIDDATYTRGLNMV